VKEEELNSVGLQPSIGGRPGAVMAKRTFIEKKEAEDIGTSRTC
jgi:hypothetical protein